MISSFFFFVNTFFKSFESFSGSLAASVSTVPRPQNALASCSAASL
jgi:hypothetical protein